MGKFIKETCYACEKEAISKEHVPPRSFFAGIDFQETKLIKVPSCDEHNHKKTEEDEFFRNILSMHVDSNDYGLRLFKSKTLHSFQDSPTKKERFISSAKQTLYHGIPTGMIPLSKESVQSYFNLLARGIFFYHYSKKTQNEFCIFPLSFEGGNFGSIKILDKLKAPTLEKHGFYPEIFYYQIISESSKFLGFRLVFMGNIIFYATSENPLRWD